MNDLNIEPLFPSRYLVTTTLGRGFTDTELKFIKATARRPAPAGRQTSSVDTYLLDHELLRDLKKDITQILNSVYQAVYTPLNNSELYITQSWGNYGLTGQQHSVHIHPNSLMSAVLYVNADKETDSITFQRGIDPGKFIFDIETKDENNCFNSMSKTIPVQTGDLVIFSSNNPHNVNCIRSNKQRISLAINTFVRGTVGDRNYLSELNLK